MRSRTAAITVVALAIAGLVVSLTALWPRSDDSFVEPGPSAALEGPASAAARPSTQAMGRADASPRETPPPPRTVRVQVAAGDIDAAVRPVGVARDGQMALPPDPDVLGWYRFGPASGEGRGSVVYAGHLDSDRYGLGQLVGLRDVEPGDRVRVTLSDRSRRDYRVVDVTRFDRQGLPPVLFARTGPERLRIITCGGEYLPEEGGYQQNLVVTAVPD